MPARLTRKDLPQGSIVKVVIGNPDTRATASGLGLIDTGATQTCIHSAVADMLKLRSRERRSLVIADGESRLVPIFSVRVLIPGISGGSNEIFIEEAFGVRNTVLAGDEWLLALIGHDLLRHFRFEYDGPSWKINEFRVAH